MNTSDIKQYKAPSIELEVTHKTLLNLNYTVITQFGGEYGVGGGDEDFFTLEDGALRFDGYHDYRESYSIDIVHADGSIERTYTFKVGGEIPLPIPLPTIRDALVYVGKFVTASDDKDRVDEYLQYREAELWPKSHKSFNAKAYIGKYGIEVVAIRENLSQATYRYVYTAAMVAHELGYTKKIPLVAIPNRIDINVPRDGMLPIIRGKTAELLMPFTSLKETIFKPGDFFKLTAATLDRIAELYAVPPEIVPAHVNAAWKRYRNELFCQARQ